MTSRLFGLALLALGLAPDLSAQTTFGVKAGVQSAVASFDEDVEGNEARLGFVAGLFADIPIRPSLSFRPEVLYSQKGYEVAVVRLGDDGVREEGSLTIQLDYLEVPLLLHYSIPVGASGIVVGLEAGPALGYKLGTGVGCGDFFEDADCDTADLDSAFRDVDLGAAIGATVGAGSFGVGLRVTQGITSINDGGDPPDGTDRVHLRNRTFAATLHYRFGGNGSGL